MASTISEPWGFSMSQVINRRTVVRGAAWSIPVVAVAANAPAFAASTDAPRPTATACKETAGSKCYRFFFTFGAQSYNWDIVLTSLVITNSTTGPAGEELILQTTPKTFTVTTTGPNVVQVQACTTGNLASSGDVVLKFTAQRTGMAPEPVTVSYSFPNIGPCA
jgi:hypothetical protein